MHASKILNWLTAAFVILSLSCQPLYAKVLIGGTPTATSSLRQVATGLTNMPNVVAPSASDSMMTRKCGFARSSVTSLNLVYYGGWIADTGNYVSGEVASDNNPTVNSWIEYPIGTTTQVTFGGVNNGSLLSGQLLMSDPVSVSIPKNANFCIYSYQTPNTGHITYIGNMDGTWLCTTCSPAEKTNLGTSGVPTTPSAFTGADNTLGKSAFVPVAVLAQSNNPAVCLIGDSIVAGLYDNGDSSYDIGSLARSVGPSYAYINIATSGDYMMGWTAANSHVIRGSLTQYCTAAIEEMGTNDLGANGAPNGMIAFKKKMAWLFQGNLGVSALPYGWTTYLPVGTTSSDSFATCTNQTKGSNNTNRVSINDLLRSPGTYGVPHFFEIANVVESAIGGGGSSNCTLTTDAGYWLSTGVAQGYTNEGTHPNYAGNILIKNSNAVNAATALSGGVPTTTDPTSVALTGVSPTYTTTSQKFGTAALNGGYGWANNAAVPGSPPYTLTAWANSSSAATTQYIAGDAGKFLRINSVTTHFDAAVVGSNVIDSSVVANDGLWHYLQLSFSTNPGGATVKATFCIDGNLVNSLSINMAASSWNPEQLPFAIRTNAANLGTNTFAGIVDEVGLFNYDMYVANGNACGSVPSAPYTSATAGLIAVYHLDSNLSPTVGPGG